MIPKKYQRVFLLTFIYLCFFNMFFSNVFAAKNNQTCEITNKNFNCLNISSSDVIKIKLLNDPYRIQIKFRNKINIKRNKVNNSRYIKSVRISQSTKAKTNLVIEFKKPTIISDIKYHDINDQNVNLNMYFSDTSEVNYAIAKYTLHKNKGDIFS